MLLLEIIEDILPIIFLMALGYFLREKKFINDGLNANLAFLVMNIALPSSIFVSVLKTLDLSRLGTLKEPLLLGAGVLVVLYAISVLLVKVCRIPRGRRGSFINGIVNTNSLFIGMPLNAALFGDKAISYFLVFYVLSLFSIWTIGATLVVNDSSSSSDAVGGSRFQPKRLLQAPLVGGVAAFLVLLLGIQVPKPLFATLNYLGNIVTGLSLIYIGISLSVAGLSSIRFDRDTLVAMVGKFVLSPVLTAGIFGLAALLGTAQPVIASQTFIVQSAVPTLAVLPILAEQGKGDVVYAANLVTIGTLLFVVVVPLVMLLVS